MNDTYVKIYVRHLHGFINIKKPIKVVFDCSNGAIGFILKKLLQNQPLISPHYINQKPDGNFPAHSPNPFKPHALDDVKKTILHQKADLGVVFDADADRAVFIDNLGQVTPFYVIAYLLSLKSKPPYIGDVYAAKTLEHLDLLKIHPSRVGTYYMKKTIKKLRASFGVEISGHYFFREIKNTDSGILTAIKSLNVLSEMPYTTAQLADLLPDFHYEQFNKKIKNLATLMKKIIKIYRKKVIKISHLDGHLFDFKDWFFIVRPSNTEPLVRFFVGSSDKEIFKKGVKKLKLVASKC